MKWNKRLKNKIICLTFMGIILFLWQDGYRCALIMKEHYTSIGVRYTKEGVELSSLIKARENEEEKESLNIPEMTAWNRLAQGELLNEVLNRSLAIPVFTVWGDMRQTAAMELLNGNYVWEEDKRGCLIDSVSAYELFGTINAVGNSVLYENKEYFIRGVIKTKSRALWIRNYQKNTKFTNLELIYPDIETGEMYGENFLFQNQLGESWILINSALYSKALYHFLLIPFWLLCILIILWWKNRELKSIPQWLLFAVSSIVLLAVCFFAVGNPIYFPRQWIPVKWSDFDYWLRFIKDIKAEFLEIRYLTPSPKDVFLLDSGRAALLEGCVVIVFLPFLKEYLNSAGLTK